MALLACRGPWNQWGSGPRSGPRGLDRTQAVGAVAVGTAQDHADQSALEDLGGRGEEEIDRRPAGAHRPGPPSRLTRSGGANATRQPGGTRSTFEACSFSPEFV